MTLKRLENYYILKKQKEFIEIQYIPSAISGMDTTKPAVQSNAVVKPTENAAIQKLVIDPQVKKEYGRICAELAALDDFIYSIPDETIKAIAIRHFIYRDSYARIAYELHYSKSSVYCMIANYVKN